MFVEPTHLHIYDNESNDEEANENHFEKYGLLICASL